MSLKNTSHSQGALLIQQNFLLTFLGLLGSKNYESNEKTTTTKTPNNRHCGGAERCKAWEEVETLLRCLVAEASTAGGGDNRDSEELSGKTVALAIKEKRCQGSS